MFSKLESSCVEGLTSPRPSIRLSYVLILFFSPITWHFIQRHFHTRLTSAHVEADHYFILATNHPIMNAQYHVGGNLFLPNPEAYGLAPERVSFARKPHFLQGILDKRGLRRK